MILFSYKKFIYLVYIEINILKREEIIMIDIKISSKIKSVCKNPVLGCVKADVKVEKSGEELLQKLDKCCEELMEKIAIEDIVSLPRIKDSREVYKALGKAPSKYRVSSEALMRRILQ